jgi:hypothetical protein
MGDKHRILFVYGGKEYAVALPGEDLAKIFLYRDTFTKSMHIGDESEPYDREKRKSLETHSIWRKWPEFHNWCGESAKAYWRDSL